MHTITKRKFFEQLRKEHNANESRATIIDENGEEHRLRTFTNIHLLTEIEKNQRNEQDAAE